MTANDQNKRGQLTPQQIAFYEAFGFFVLRQVFAHEELKIIGDDFESIMQQGHGRTTHGESELARLIEHRPNFKRFLSRIEMSIEQVLGPGFVMTDPGSHFRAGDTGWHCDIGWHPSMFGREQKPPIGHDLPGVRVGVYLDRRTRDTGCLRVIPGSHIMPNACLDLLAAPFHRDMSENFSADGKIRKFGIRPNDVPCHAVETDPGDMILFNHRTWHAAFGGKHVRRMITIDYKAKPTTARDHQYIQHQLEEQRETAEGLTN